MRPATSYLAFSLLVVAACSSSGDGGDDDTTDPGDDDPGGDDPGGDDPGGDDPGGDDPGGDDPGPTGPKPPHEPPPPAPAAGQPLGTPETMQLCEDVCALETWCDAMTPSTCTADCVDELQYYRGDVIVSAFTCELEGDCSTDLFMCWDNAVNGVANTAAYDAYVPACTSWATRCMIMEAGCDDGYAKVFHDTVLTGITACLDDPCEQVEACINQVLPPPA